MNRSRSSSVYAGFSCGMIHCAVRWNIVRCCTRGAIAVTICTAVDPVPTTPTRAPSIATLWSQRELWNCTPAKESRPSKSGYARVMQHARRRDHDVDIVVVTLGRLEVPPAVGERAAHHLVVETNALDDTEVAGNPFEIRPDLGAGREPVTPVGRERERVRVEMRRNVACETGVRVLAPRSADGRALLVHREVGEARFGELDRAQDAGHAGADHREPQWPLVHWGETIPPTLEAQRASARVVRRGCRRRR